MGQTYPHMVRCSCGKCFSNWQAWSAHYQEKMPSPCNDRPLAERQIAWQRREAYHARHKAYEVRLDIQSRPKTGRMAR